MDAIQVSVEEYLRTNYEPNAEYIDGVVRPKAMGTGQHGRIQLRLGRILEDLGLSVAVELTVQISPTKFLIPDVAADTSIGKFYPDRPVLLCVEVLSPEDRTGSMLAKCEQYHEWGVPYCWVIDPWQYTAWEYHKDSRPEERHAGEMLAAGEIRIAISDVFAGM